MKHDLEPIDKHLDVRQLPNGMWTARPKGSMDEPTVGITCLEVCLKARERWPELSDHKDQPTDA